jgi:hypothetical protein
VQNQALAPELPIRFYYLKDEQNPNSVNEGDTANKLEVTPYSTFGTAWENNNIRSKRGYYTGRKDRGRRQEREAAVKNSE